MDEISAAVLFGVSLTTDKLSTNELGILTHTVASDDCDLKRLPFYEKIKLILAEDGTLHKETREAIIVLAGMRLHSN